MPTPRMPIISPKTAGVIVIIAAVIVPVTLAFVFFGPSTTTGSDADHGSGGEPSAQETARDTPGESSSSPRRAAVLTQLDPCSMLSPEQAIAHGYTATPERGPFGADTCLYLPEGVTAGAGVISLSISFGDGLSALTPPPTDRAVPQRVGGYDAVRIEAAAAPRCTLTLGISAAESVQVSVTRSTLREACEQANRVAEQIEPQLPVPAS